MMAQMAATAGSIAVGSTIGHGISSMLFGGSSPAPESQASTSSTQQAGRCDAQAKGISSTRQISIHHLTHPIFPERLHKVRWER